MTKARLLDDDEGEQEFQPIIVVNEEFAKRFEVGGWCWWYLISAMHPILALNPAAGLHAVQQAAGGAAQAAGETSRVGSKACKKGETAADVKLQGFDYGMKTHTC
jgi:hypothetical protein